MREIIQLRGWIVHHHLVFDEEGVHLIDGGFVGGISRIRRALATRGMDFADVRSLVLTHGHLDHTLNAAALKELTGCRVYGPLMDRGHLAGRYRPRGWNRLGSWLEAMGKLVFRWTAPDVDEWFEDGDEICAGLQVVALPGHTVGHCGFYWEEEKLLMAADLFTNQFGCPKPPPRIFNDNHEQALRSIRNASRMELKEVLLNHTRRMSPDESVRSLRRLAGALFPEDEGIEVTPEKRRKHGPDDVECDERKQ